MTAQSLHALTPGTFVEQVTVTPEVAKAWLARNTRNRRVNRNHVTTLAAAMQPGRWWENGDTIKFDRDGNLCDGQHRLLAVIESGATIRMWVVRGLDPRSQFTMDLGRPRSVAQQLELLGVASSNAIASAGLGLWRYLHHSHGIWSSNTLPSKSEQVEFSETYLHVLRPGALLAMSASRDTNIIPTGYAVFIAAALLAGRDDSMTEFHEGFVSGANLAPGDPRLALRRYAAQRRSARGTWMQQETVAVTVKAFNAYLAGREVKLLRFLRSELPMPVVGR